MEQLKSQEVQDLESKVRQSGMDVRNERVKGEVVSLRLESMLKAVLSQLKLEKQWQIVSRAEFNANVEIEQYWESLRDKDDAKVIKALE